ncbi:MAG: BrnA antitoxin family protein [Deltaproteobacteria bacterium]|jgi:predicted DNA binding CopG/RHH family protein|nr:BrnA antitoxin family protein [Deltaproteobacteria bacterium]
MKHHAIRPLPSLKSDADAAAFVASADLSEYDLSGFAPVQFEFEPKTAVLNMRLPHNLLAAVKIRAKAQGMPYTRYIRLVLEQSITS